MADDSKKYTRYVYLLTHNPGLVKDMPLIKAHVAHLKMLDESHQLELCGPFTDFDGGMVILKNVNRDEAKTIAENDPFVVSGVESYELRTWELSCEENNHMGMG